MSKFILTKVHYDAGHRCIEKANGCIENIFSADGMEFDRRTIFDMITAGFIFQAHRVDSSGKEIEGPRVKIVRVNDIEYLRTEADGIEGDNLGELPEY